MTDLREAIARTLCRSRKFECGQGACAFLCLGHPGGDIRSQPQGCPSASRIHADLIDAVLAILPDADELAEALDECLNSLGQIPAPMSAPLWFNMCGAMKRARTALANYRKGTGCEG